MKTRHKLRHIWAIVVAFILAVSMIATYAFADGDHDERPSDPGGGPKPTHGEWFVDDNNHAPTVDSAKWFIQQMNNKTGKIAGGSDSKIQETLNGAVARCQARGGTNCRLVAVGIAITNDGWYSAKNLIGSGGVQAYKNNLYSFGNKTLSYNGYNYDINTPFQRVDGSQTTVARLGEESINAVGGDANINVIVLSQDEPAKPKTPPAPPVKRIEQGISADRMRNTTFITTGTGVGGEALWFSDTINPNGLTYTITDQSVWDITTGANISNQFTYNTANGQTPTGNRATAVWNANGRKVEKLSENIICASTRITCQK
ncbi:hypothetical protein B9G54_00230 [Alloscardovia macacae]|nr:hypothetical protein B9G54_00230 [Alloscardovia macacae]